MTPLGKKTVPAFFALLLLGGCATHPQASLPKVESQLATRTDAKVTWPVTDDERTKADAAVRELLANELTIESAVQIALLNNRTLRATFEELGLSQADLVEAGQLANPSFSALVRWPTDSPRVPHTEFRLSMEVLDAIFLPVRKRLAQEQVAQAEQRVAHEVLRLIAEVKAAALSHLAERQFRERLAVIADVNATTADLAQRQFDAGNINRLELLQLQTAADQTTLDITRADAELRAGQARLNLLLGLTGEQANWEFAAGLPALPAVEPSFDEIEAVAVAQRLDLAAARGQVGVAETALNLTRRTRFLPVAIQIGVETEKESNGERLTGPSFDFELPIFDQGQAELMRAESLWRQSRDRYEALESEILTETRAACDALLAARDAAEYYTQRLLPRRQEILRETLLHYNAMQVSNYVLLAAKAEEQTAERESIDALRDYWIARAELERAIGGKIPGALAPESTPATPTPPPSTEAPSHQHNH